VTTSSIIIIYFSPRCYFHFISRHTMGHDNEIYLNSRAHYTFNTVLLCNSINKPIHIHKYKRMCKYTKEHLCIAYMYTCELYIYIYAYSIQTIVLVSLSNRLMTLCNGRINYHKICLKLSELFLFIVLIINA